MENVPTPKDAPTKPAELAARAAAVLEENDMGGWTRAAPNLHPNLRWPLPPSTSPEEPEFHPRSYWRGPVWPVMNWLLWWSLVKAGEKGRAIQLRNHGLAQLSDGRFGEYYEPFTGEPLGSDEQSWTAAVALDWLANIEEVSENP